MTDEEVLNFLIQVKGIGEWSVHMFLMFGLGRRYCCIFIFIIYFISIIYFCVIFRDVLPHGDLVVRKGFKRLYRLDGGEGLEDTKVKKTIKNRNRNPLNSPKYTYTIKQNRSLLFQAPRSS